MDKVAPYRPENEPPDAAPLWEQAYNVKAQIQGETDPAKLKALRDQRGKLSQQIRRTWQNGAKAK